MGNGYGGKVRLKRSQKSEVRSQKQGTRSKEVPSPSKRIIKYILFLSTLALLISESITVSAFTISDPVKGGYARKLFINDHYLYLADWYSGLHIYDIAYPYKPVHLTNIHTPGSPKGIYVRDNIAYVGDDDHGLQIIDVSNPLS